MADFAAVLRKTIAGLKDNTPEARDRIYQKARSTIEAKLKAVNPPPPQHLFERQMQALEDAIKTVEAEYPRASSETLPGLDEVLRDLEALSKRTATAPTVAEPAPAPTPDAAADPVKEAPEAADELDDADADDDIDDTPSEEEADEPQPEVPVVPLIETKLAARKAAVKPVEEISLARLTDDEAEVEVPEPARAPAPAPQPKPAQTPAPRDILADPVTDGLDDRLALRELRERKAKRSFKKPLMAAAAVLLIAAIAAGGWLYRDQAMELAGNFLGKSGVVADSTNTEEPAEESARQQVASQNGSADAETPRKLTQRLLPDGSEVDEGPASGSPTLGEGTSVAASTDMPPSAGIEQNNTSEAGQNQPAIAGGQKAIFYEERTIQEQASASDGNVVWRIEQESPGANLPPEPVIYAEATIPAKRLSLKMSIRRNVDQSLPASYIAELIFLTPEDFSGGAVGTVASVSLKRTEEDAGNRLLGIPAKIADGFFLVALSDNKADIEANNLLLGRMEWIDIPIVYTSGRRALITLEKGAPGVSIFNEALAAWKQATSG